MCRLFGCRSRDPGGVSHELFHGATALRVQSREHPDGWGVGWYESGAPRVIRSLTPAHGDVDFEKLSHFVAAQTVLAHVRKASVGRVSMENTHPFQRGPWLFAHNGTLPDWERARGPLEALIHPSLRPAPWPRRWGWCGRSPSAVVRTRARRSWPPTAGSCSPPAGGARSSSPRRPRTAAAAASTWRSPARIPASLPQAESAPGACFRRMRWS